jgi:hypothetical protein
MASFPAITSFNSNVINKIENTPKESFSGNAPFIQLTEFITNNSISTNSYRKFKLTNTVNYKERFPPIITGMTVGLTGSLGTVRRAKIQIKFASSSQIETYKNFLKIGNVQMVSWGWTKTAKFGGNSLKTAQEIVMNISKWQEHIKNTGNEVDMLAGLLVNFSMQMNSDMTVDVEIELGSPSEIPGYMALHNKNKTSSTDSAAPGEELVKMCRALNLDGTVTGTTTQEIEMNSVNYFKQRNANIEWGTSSDSYIRLGFAIEQICNKFVKVVNDDVTLELAIDLRNSVASGHPNMISVSENVLFPNEKTMGFTDTIDNTGSRLLVPDTVNTQHFGPFNGAIRFPEANMFMSVITPQGPSAVKFDDYYAGYIENVYLRTEFLIDIAKGCESIHDFLQKIVDEINISAAGLMDLVIRELPSSKGKLVYTIVDLNLEQTTLPKIPSLNVFGSNGRVIELGMNCDLPKELISMLMVSPGSRHWDSNSAISMFGNVYPDNVLKVAKPETQHNSDTVKVEVSAWDAITNQLWAKFSSFFNLAGENRIKFAPSNTIGDSSKAIFGVFKDVSVVKSVYFSMDYKRRNALVPITISFTVMGISGITVGTSLNFEPSPMPWVNKNAGVWQVTNVEHSVDSSIWKTTIECKFRATGNVKRAGVDNFSKNIKARDAKVNETSQWTSGYGDPNRENTGL